MDRKELSVLSRAAASAAYAACWAVAKEVLWSCAASGVIHTTSNSHRLHAWQAAAAWQPVVSGTVLACCSAGHTGIPTLLKVSGDLDACMGSPP